MVGYIGELLPSAGKSFELRGRVAIAELDLDPLLTPIGLKEAVTPSTYPPVDFDLSFVVDQDTSSAAVVKATREAGSDLVETARVFDEFKGGDLARGERAIAINYRLRAPDRTLSNEAVGPIRSAMIAAAEELGARLRGAE